jgi:hypothetical protein
MTDFHCADQSYAYAGPASNVCSKCLGLQQVAHGAARGFTVSTEEIAAQIRAWGRLFHSPG